MVKVARLPSVFQAWRRRPDDAQRVLASYLLRHSQQTAGQENLGPLQFLGDKIT